MWFSWILFLSLVVDAYGYRYLFFTANIGYSHMQYAGKLADTLVEKGHQVDVIIAVFSKFVPTDGVVHKANVTKIIPKRLEIINKQVMECFPYAADVFQHDGELFTRETIPKIRDATGMLCHDIMTSDHMDVLRSKKYDAAFSEDFDVCSLAIYRKLGIRTVMLISPIPVPSLGTLSFGLPSMLSFTPMVNYSPAKPWEMTLWQRIETLYYYVRLNLHIFPSIHEHLNKEVRGNATGHVRGSLIPHDFPTSFELLRDAVAIFANTNDAYDIPNVSMQKIHKIGGIAVAKVKQLKKEILSVIDSSEKGIVLVSFGSIVDTTKMKPNILKSFIRAFANFPEYKFIWKFDTKTAEVAFANTTNIHAVDWVDQSSLLAHPRTRAFLSHVGLNSLNEALYHGVPLIALPFFGDQTYNRAIVENSRVGVSLDKRRIDEATITDALKKVLYNEEYAHNAKRVGQMIRRKDPSKRFVDAVEFSTEFADELRRTNIPNLHWFFLYGYDLFCLFCIGLCVMCLLIALTFIGMRRIWLFSQSALLSAGQKLKQS